MVDGSIMSYFPDQSQCGEVLKKLISANVMEPMWFVEMENRLNMKSQHRNCASKSFLVLKILRKENG